MCTCLLYFTKCEVDKIFHGLKWVTTNTTLFPGNTTQLRIFKLRVCRLWQSVLVRRSQRAKMCWERFTPVLNRWIPPPRVLHPYPDAVYMSTIEVRTKLRGYGFFELTMKLLRGSRVRRTPVDKANVLLRLKEH